jgi:hypothetical protein
MRAISISVFVLSVASSFCYATPSANIDSIVCSGTQTSSFLDVLSLTCTGDLSLFGGSISADSKILISAIGALTLGNLSITAPEVEFIAGSSLSLGNGVAITANSISIYADIDNDNGSIPPFVSPGGTISIGGGVGRPREGGNIQLPPGGSISITGGGSGGLITILPSVPEPETYVTMLAGLLALAGIARMKRHRIRGL